jgi:hypothetical protein
MFRMPLWQADLAGYSSSAPVVRRRSDLTLYRGQAMRSDPCFRHLHGSGCRFACFFEPVAQRSAISARLPHPSSGQRSSGSDRHLRQPDLSFMVIVLTAPRVSVASRPVCSVQADRSIERADFLGSAVHLSVAWVEECSIGSMLGTDFCSAPGWCRCFWRSQAVWLRDISTGWSSCAPLSYLSFLARSVLELDAQRRSGGSGRRPPPPKLLLIVLCVDEASCSSCMAVIRSQYSTIIRVLGSNRASQHRAHLDLALPSYEQPHGLACQCFAPKKPADLDAVTWISPAPITSRVLRGDVPERDVRRSSATTKQERIRRMRHADTACDPSWRHSKRRAG